jgi:hypothetical protein
MILLLLSFRRPLPAYYVQAEGQPDRLVQYFTFYHITSAPDRERLARIVDSLESNTNINQQLSELTSMAASGCPDALFILGVVHLFGLFDQPLDDQIASLHLFNDLRAGHVLAPPLLFWMRQSSHATLPVLTSDLWADPYSALADSPSCEATWDVLRPIIHQWYPQDEPFAHGVGGPVRSLYDQHLFDQAVILNHLWDSTVSRDEYFDYILGYPNRSELSTCLARAPNRMSARPPTGIRESFDYLDRRNVLCSNRVMGHFKRLTIFRELLGQAEAAFVAEDWQYLGQATLQLVGWKVCNITHSNFTWTFWDCWPNRLAASVSDVQLCAHLDTPRMFSCINSLVDRNPSLFIIRGC